MVRKGKTDERIYAVVKLTSRMDGTVLELDKTSYGQETHSNDADHLQLAHVNSRGRVFSISRGA